MCDVNLDESLRSILDSEFDCIDDDEAWVYDSSCDKYDDDLPTIE